MEDVSQIRKGIAAANKRREFLLHQLMKIEPFLAAQVYERYKKCGNKNCKCARGELHGPFVWLYQNKKNEKLLSTSVPKELAQEAKMLADNYKDIQEKRKEIREIDSEINLLLNKIEQLMEKDALKYVTKDKKSKGKSKKDQRSTEEKGD